MTFSIPPEFQSILQYVVPLIVGYLIRVYFPNLKLPTRDPSPAPSPSPAPAPVLPAIPSSVGHGELLALALELLKSRQPQPPTPQALSISTAGHDVSIDGTGVSVTQKPV